MRSRLLALAALAGLAAASAQREVIPAPVPPRSGYRPGDFRWRKVKGSYSRTLAARLAAKRKQG